MQVNYLQHHGLKGQKWGVRRFQYEDDSLTPEGKIRYGVGDGRKSQSLKEQAQRDDPDGMRAKAKLNTRKAIAAIGGVAGLAAASVAGLDLFKRQSLLGTVYKKDLPQYYSWVDKNGVAWTKKMTNYHEHTIEKWNLNQFHNFDMTKKAAVGIAAVATVGAAVAAVYNHVKYKKQEQAYYSSIGQKALSQNSQQKVS